MKTVPATRARRTGAATGGLRSARPATASGTHAVASGRFDLLTADDLTALQRSAGNRALAAAVQRAAAGPPAPTGGATGGVTSGGGPAAAAGPSSCSTPGCPSMFCADIGTITASAMRSQLATGILAGIAAKVSPRVVPLWSQYIHGGTGVQDLSSRFGADFTNSPTTRAVTEKIQEALRTVLVSSPPLFAPGQDEVTTSLDALVPTELAGVNVTGHANEMNFSVIGDIPGNIAGGIGRNQTSCRAGARPGPFDDHRRASGTVRIRRLSDGSLRVVPDLRYVVHDTIDLCPGNCGESIEMIATIPLSQWEASGISGDVPFIVRFPGRMAPFTIAAAELPAPPPTPPTPPPTPTGPVNARVRAHPTLRIRQAPSTASPKVGSYPDGAQIRVDCQVPGEEILGNDRWDRTDRGFVSDRYVVRTAEPGAC